MRRFSFTLIEILIAIGLLSLVGGLVGIKMHGAIQQRRFSSCMEQLKERVAVVQKLAVASQVDWVGVLREGERGWTFFIEPEEKAARSFRPLSLGAVDLFWNGSKVQKNFEFRFFSSGYAIPKGRLLLQAREHESSCMLRFN